jgi:hypothetical protein
VSDLDDIYRRLAIPLTNQQLAAHYRTAEGHGATVVEAGDQQTPRPISLLATAIPPSATVSVAIHVLHALPSSASRGLPDQLLDNLERNAADALRRCHCALDADGAARGYTLEEWLPTVFDIAGPLLESARPDAEPPTAVGAAQDAIIWLSRAFVELDEDSTEAPGALAEALARLLIVWVFATLARDRWVSR